jgi:glycosyltransferase involved in cell wall biosynthesis
VLFLMSRSVIVHRFVPGGGWIEEAHSLLSDSGLNYEILVCNDGSSDQTGEMIERLAGSLPRLRVLRQARNL